MDKQKELEMLFEKLRAFKSLTVEAQEFFKDEIAALVKRINELQA